MTISFYIFIQSVKICFFIFYFIFTDDHMYQPERFRISIPDTVPTYAYVGPYVSTVSYQYPYEIVVKRDDRHNVSLSETTAIRRELSQIKNDIGEIKRQQASPTYYIVKEDYPNVECPICNASASKNQQIQYSQIPMYYCERCRSFIEEPAYSVVTKIRAKTPTTTYQDSYTRPPYSSPLARRITLNELQTQPLPSSTPAQHPRHWIPTGYKNAYPHRRWNLSVPHSEP
jgi:ribosomal protein L37AE/L43A